MFRGDSTERFSMIRASNECDFGLCVTDVMYAGHIIGQDKKCLILPRIMDIEGGVRRGGQI
jgi:hypothetical protein